MRGPRLHWPPPGVRVLTSVTLDLASSSLSSPPPNTGTLSFSTSPSSGIAPSGVPELAQLLRDLHPQLPCSEELWYTMPYVIPSRRRGFHLGRTPPPPGSEEHPPTITGGGYIFISPQLRGASRGPCPTLSFTPLLRGASKGNRARATAGPVWRCLNMYIVFFYIWYLPQRIFNITLVRSASDICLPLG